MSLHNPFLSVVFTIAVTVLLISEPTSAQVVEITTNEVAPGSAVASPVEEVPATQAERYFLLKKALFVSDANLPVRVQLTKLDGTTAKELAGSAVTVVFPDGEQRRFKANNQGAIVFKVRESGLYAVIKQGPMGHAAIPVAVRVGDKPDEDADSKALIDPTPTISLPVFTLGANEALRAVNSFVPPGNATLSDIDKALVVAGELTPSPNYLVNLSDTGRLEGQVLTLLRSELNARNLEGNNLLLYRDGQLLSRAITDSLGRFAFEELEAGHYGIICAGPAGYAAFAFEALVPALIASTSKRETLVNTLAQQAIPAGPFADGNVLPVTPIPRSFVPGLASLLRETELPEEQTLPADAAFAPVPSGGGAGFGGPGGGGGGIGGAGGMLGLATLGVAAAIAASDSNNDRVITNPSPDPATPANVLP
jgi:hypothetical protein